MNPAQAAASGNLMLVLLCCSLGLCALLGAYSWYAYKEKQAAIKLRFSDGRSRFEKQERRQDELAEKQSRIENVLSKVCAEYIHRDQCSEQRNKHDEIHAKLEQKLDRMIDNQTEQGKQIVEMGATIKTVASTTVKLLAAKVTIPADGDEI